MSKSNLFLGTAQGKFGDVVFYRAGGQQRHRPLVTPKNPRTSAQMAQRVRLANVPAFYRVMQGIIKDSFSNRPSNQSGYNAFARGAIEISPFLTKEMAVAGSVIPAPYMVSRGVISSLPCEIVGDDNSRLPVLPLTIPSSGPTTVGAWSQLIMSTYPQLQNGDILTFVRVAFSVEEFGESLDIHKAGLSSYQLVLDSTSDVALTSGDFYINNRGFAPLLPPVSENVAVAIIASRKLADGTLQTSTSFLVLDDTAQTLYENYRTEQALSEAIASYGRGEESILR